MFFKKVFIRRKRKKRNYSASSHITSAQVRIRGRVHTIQSLDFSDKDLETYLRRICKEKAIYFADIYSKKIGYNYNKLTIKKLVSKRGSCSSKQNININLYLVHLPEKNLEYVVAHEVTHLKHKHHRASFWQELERLMPGYSTIKKDLKGIRIK